MRKIMWAGTLAVLVMLSLVFSSVLPVSHAQGGSTPQAAIDLAAAHPAFATGLAVRPGWTASAYDSQNKYGIWHVQFWDASGEDLGWADLSLERGKVYSWETHFNLTDEQAASAETAIRAFLVSSPDVMELAGSLDDVSIYVDYDQWTGRWNAYIDLGPDFFSVSLRSATGQPSSLEDLQIDRIYFSNMPSYEEWFSAHEAQAISIAFQQPEISAALRNANGWTAAGEIGEDGMWHITFTLNDTTLATAAVTLDPPQVTEFGISG